MFVDTGRNRACSYSRDVTRRSLRPRRRHLIWFALASVLTIGHVLSWSISAPAGAEKEEISGGVRLHPVASLAASHGALRVALSPDGKLVAAGGTGPTVAVWEVDRKGSEQTLTDGRGGVKALTFSPDGRYLAVGRVGPPTSDRIVENRDARSLSLIRSLPGTGSPNVTGIRSVRFSPDSRWLLARAEAAAIVVYDVADGKVIRIIEAPVDLAGAIALIEQGRKVVFGAKEPGRGYELRIADVKTGALLKTVDATDMVWALAPGSSSSQVVTGDRSGTISMYDVASGRRERSVEGHKAPVEVLGFLPRGRGLVSVGQDSAIRIWETRSLKQTASFDIRPRLVLGADMNQLGRLAIGHEDGVLVWEVSR